MDINFSKLFQQLYNFSISKVSWILLFSITFALELSALFFQHVLLLAPCVMCIYERIAMLGILAGATIGMINPQNKFFRYAGALIWIMSTYQGLLLSLKHVDYQTNPSPFNTCDLFVKFPKWLPLDQYIPWMFAPSGDCSKITWQFLTLSMPQWLMIIFAINLIVAILVVISQIFGVVNCKDKSY